MVVTIDVQESVRQILYDRWNLHGNLSRGSLGPDGFNTGVPAAARKYPSIEVLPVSERHTVLSVDWWMMNPLVHVHVWERPRTITKNNLATAKNNRRFLVQEVKRILHKHQTAAEDIEFMMLDDEINADQFHGLEEEKMESSRAVQEGFFPILHTIIPVRVIQFHSATLGGIPANR